MSYERDKMLAGINETSWREMDAFARRVAEIYDDQPEGTADNAAAWMARALVTAAGEELAHDAEQAAAAKAAKAAGGPA